jgi:hypothetical protein
MFSALDYLEQAAKLLYEALYIGLWVKSEGCEDNRRKRQALREADWSVASAERAATDAQLQSELHALDAMIEPSPTS